MGSSFCVGLKNSLCLMQTLTLFLKATLSVSWKNPRPSRLNRNGSRLFPGDPTCFKIVSKLSKVVLKLSLSFLKVVPELGQSCPNVVSQLSQSYSKVVSKLSLGSASGSGSFQVVDNSNCCLNGSTTEIFPRRSPQWEVPSRCLYLSTQNQEDAK